MKSIYRFFCVGIFIVGVITFSQARMTGAQLEKGKGDDLEPAAPYVVKYIIYRKAPDGNLTILGRRTRYVKANGEWRLIGHGPDEEQPNSNSTVMVSGPGGVQKRHSGSNELFAISPSADEQVWQSYRSHSFLRNHNLFVRDDEIAGVKVYVLRTEIADSAHPLAWAETAYSPKTGFIQLRTVNHFRDNSEVKIEAISVEFKEVPENLNDDLKDLPVKQPSRQ
jgi:hypothetical protein